MAEFPALPIFTDAFIADTIHLNAIQTGAYFMLLMVAWRTKSCTLPDDDSRLAAFARMDKRTWNTHKSVIMSFWHKDENGDFYQKRLRDERKFAEDRRNQAVQAGKASALKRKERHSTGVITERQQKGNNPKPLPKPSYTSDDKGVDNPPWFEGHVIKLNKKDFYKWRDMTGWTEDYLHKVLSDRDDWLADNPAKSTNWFLSTSAFLKKSSQA